jgi:hypothetical protein
MLDWFKDDEYSTRIQAAVIWSLSGRRFLEDTSILCVAKESVIKVSRQTLGKFCCIDYGVPTIAINEETHKIEIKKEQNI